MRASKVRQWLLEYMSSNRESAFTIPELTELCPKDRIKKNAKNPESAVNSAMVKLVANGLVMRKGSYHIRTNGKRKYTKRNNKPEEKASAKNGKSPEKKQ